MSTKQQPYVYQGASGGIFGAVQQASATGGYLPGSMTSAVYAFGSYYWEAARPPGWRDWEGEWLGEMVQAAFGPGVSDDGVGVAGNELGRWDYYYAGGAEAGTVPDTGGALTVQGRVIVEFGIGAEPVGEADQSAVGMQDPAAPESPFGSPFGPAYASHQAFGTEVLQHGPGGSLGPYPPGTATQSGRDIARGLLQTADNAPSEPSFPGGQPMPPFPTPPIPTQVHTKTPSGGDPEDLFGSREERYPDHAEAGPPPSSPSAPRPSGYPTGALRRAPFTWLGPGASGVEPADLDRALQQLSDLSPTFSGAVSQAVHRRWRIRLGGAGQGTHADSRRRLITVDPNSFADTRQLARELAHEVGHAVMTPASYVYAPSMTPEEYIGRNTEIDLLAEANADILALRVRDEVIAGPLEEDIGISATAMAPKLLYWDYYKAQMMDRDALAVELALIISAERPSGTPEGVTYWTYYALRHEAAWNEAHATR